MVKKLQNTNDLSALLEIGAKKKSVKPAEAVVDNDAFVLKQNKDFIKHNINLACDRSQGLLPPISTHSPNQSLSKKASV